MGYRLDDAELMTLLGLYYNHSERLHSPPAFEQLNQVLWRAFLSIFDDQSELDRESGAADARNGWSFLTGYSSQDNDRNCPGLRICLTSQVAG
jgi:hypothetical protein